MKIYLFTLIFLLVGCDKGNKKINTNIKIINEIMSSMDIDSELWHIKIIKKEVIQTSHKLVEDLKCEEFDVIYTINLKKDCYQSQGLFDLNSITSGIKRMLVSEDVYEKGNCYTQSDVNANIEKWKKDHSKLIGSTVCQSYQNTILGGECDKEITMTQELVDEDVEIVKQKAQASLRGKAHLKIGHSILKRAKAEVCSNLAGKNVTKIMPLEN